MTDSPSAPVLSVTERGDKTAAQLRRDGLTPLELYGHGKENRHLAASTKEVEKLLREHGLTTLIDIEEGGKRTKVLFAEPQHHPAGRQLLHLDLHAVNLKEKITAAVPLVFVGVAPAVDVLGGTLIEAKQEVEVECLPTDLPHELEVDIASLATFEDSLYVKDIVVPSGVEVLDDPEESIASIQEPRSEEELAALDEKIEDVNLEEAVEVEEKGKDQEEAGEEESAS